nr:MAG TPA: hypothetical protein [Caudoviricetes sp.]
MRLHGLKYKNFFSLTGYSIVYLNYTTINKLYMQLRISRYAYVITCKQNTTTLHVNAYRCNK